MKRLITVNDREVGILRDVLLYVLQSEFDGFPEKVKAAGFLYDYSNVLSDMDYMRANLTAELKEEPYYKALELYSELSETLVNDIFLSRS